MTEENNSEEGVVFQHKLLWRSEGTLYVHCIACLLNKVNKKYLFENFKYIYVVAN